MARAAGHPDVTAAAVHEWVMDGLLPGTGEQASVGRHGFVTAPRAGVEPQLLALCRLRVATRSWNHLVIRLWLDEWTIATPRLKRALAALIPHWPNWRLWPPPLIDELDRLISQDGPAMLRRIGVRRVDDETALYGLRPLIALALGSGRPLDEASADAIERLAGFIPGARRDRVGGTGPWLSGPSAAGLAGSAQMFSAAGMHDLIDAASEAGLAAARPGARCLASGLPRVVRAAELLYGRNVAGLGLVGRLLEKRPDLAVLTALGVSDTPLEANLEALVEAIDPISDLVARQLPAFEYYIRQHPHQRAAIRKTGLVALAQAGQLAPLTAEQLSAVT